MSQPERRKHRRLEIRLPLEYSLSDQEASHTYRTITRNVSTGGVYFEIQGQPLNQGEKLNLELTVPPGGHFPYQGRVSTVAEITRVARLHPDKAHSPRAQRFGIGARIANWVLSF